MAPKRKIKKGGYYFDIYEKTIIVNGNNTIFLSRTPSTDDVNALLNIIRLGEKRKRDDIKEKFDHLFD